MDHSRSCTSCNKKTLVRDDVTGNSVCASCGVVQEFDNFQDQIGGITGITGTFVRVGTAGTGSFYKYKETKIYKAQKVIEDLSFKLGFSPGKSQELKSMVEKITEGEYGEGRWFPIFVGACGYVIRRNDDIVLPIGEVSNMVGCDVYEMGRMVSKVVDFLDLKLPEFDVVKAFEHAVNGCLSLDQVDEDLAGSMLKQGVFLVQCMVKWFLTTGRRPMPVVAAVLMFVAELNGIGLRIEDVASELGVSVKTCKLRHKELLERLVKVAQGLPWGKDVTRKNIMKNARFVIQYMELKSISGENTTGLEIVGFNLDDMVGDCLRKDDGYRADRYELENQLQHHVVEHPLILETSESLDKLQISHECLAMIYSKYRDEISAMKSTEENRIGPQRKKQRRYDLDECTEWWTGKSEMSKKLLLKQILEKDVGLEDNPPSFDKGCLAYERRRERINAAKLRIQKIMHPLGGESGDSNNLCLSTSVKSGKKRRKPQVSVDWEDFIIEALLLHQVKEEEIEKGHYNTLLDLHVYNYVC